jgi:hypothetical protein
MVTQLCEVDWTPVVNGLRFTWPFLLAYVVLACVQGVPLPTGRAARKVQEARAVSLQVAIVFLLGFSFEVIVTPLVADQRDMLWLATKTGVLVVVQLVVVGWWWATRQRYVLTKPARVLRCVS